MDILLAAALWGAAAAVTIVTFTVTLTVLLAPLASLLPRMVGKAEHRRARRRGQQTR